MTQRLFYRDPLAAAWQAKHFGMRLECLNQEDDEGVDQEDVGSTYPFEQAMVEVLMWGEIIAQRCRRIYIDAESLHLLEPKVGDLVSDGERSCRFLGTGSRDINGKIAIFNSEERIIQRAGIPFHWPESEEV